MPDGSTHTSTHAQRTLVSSVIARRLEKACSINAHGQRTSTHTVNAHHEGSFKTPCVMMRGACWKASAVALSTCYLRAARMMRASSVRGHAGAFSCTSDESDTRLAPGTRPSEHAGALGSEPDEAGGVAGQVGVASTAGTGTDGCTDSRRALAEGAKRSRARASRECSALSIPPRVTGPPLLSGSLGLSTRPPAGPRRSPCGWRGIETACASRSGTDPEPRGPRPPSRRLLPGERSGPASSASARSTSSPADHLPAGRSAGTPPPARGPAWGLVSSRPAEHFDPRTKG